MTRISWFVIGCLLCMAALIVNDLRGDSEPIGLNASHFDSVSSSREAISSPDVISNMEEIATTKVSTSENIDVVTRWMIAINASDAIERDAAAEALVATSREKILPTLEHFIVDGSDAERQQAIAALRLLAFKQGDDAGEIRNILRLTSYDGDESLASHAQLALEDIESNVDLWSVK